MNEKVGLNSPAAAATRHTQTGNGQPLWGNSIRSSSTVKKIESCRHLGGRFNGVNIYTAELRVFGSAGAGLLSSA